MDINNQHQQWHQTTYPFRTNNVIPIKYWYLTCMSRWKNLCTSAQSIIWVNTLLNRIHITVILPRSEDSCMIYIYIERERDLNGIKNTNIFKCPHHTSTKKGEIIIIDTWTNVYVWQILFVSKSKVSCDVYKINKNKNIENAHWHLQSKNATSNLSCLAIRVISIFNVLIDVWVFSSQITLCVKCKKLAKNCQKYTHAITVSKIDNTIGQYGYEHTLKWQ